MKFKNFTKAALALVAAALTFVSAQTASAAASYHVTVNTSSLIGDSAAPFALDFILTGGNALANTVTLSNFSFGIGGSATSNPAAANFGLSSGSLGSGITLSDSSSSFLNEFYQGFIPGSVLQFDIVLTTNLNGPTPDAFSFAILDSTLSNITTNGPGDSLLLININSANPTAQTYSSTNGVTVSVVPEPSSAMLLGSAVVGVCGVMRRRRAA